ncbi:MAG: LTA synthase family protein [Lentisphaeria bacterium]|nr:LTA synthase family protein [Lentisphaeria bacterium]
MTNGAAPNATGNKKDCGRRFFLLLTALFLLPYLLAVLRLGLAPLKDGPLFWCGRVLFPLSAAALICGLVSLFRRRTVRQVAAVLLWLGVQVFILLECFQLCFTGKSFNEAFLMHFSLKVLTVGLKSDMGVFAVPGVLFLAAAGFAVWKVSASLTVPERVLKNALLAAAGFALWFVPQSPVVILISLIWNNCHVVPVGPAACSDEVLRQNGIHPCAVGIRDLKAERGRNLVFIIVESLEQNYLDPQRFPGLMPCMEKLLGSKDALYFQSMRSDSSNTFDFLYKSHMGTHMESVFSPQEAGKLPSLSLILQKAGYRSSFLKACSLDFSNTRGFLRQVQYQRMLDCDAPEIRQTVKEIGAWGFRDYDLFAFAEKEFDRLAAGREPFIFTVLTVDGHAPNGVLGRRSLTYRLPDGREFPLLSAVHTTDAAMGKFIEHIRNSPAGADTVIAVSGDHLVMQNPFDAGETVQSLLARRKRNNVLCFMLNGAQSGVVEQPCWTVDIAPVLLDQMGVRHNYVFPSGVNILKEKDDFPRGGFSREHLTVYLRSKRDGKARYAAPLDARDAVLAGNRTAPRLQLGDLSVPLLAFDHHKGTIGVEIPRKNREKTLEFSFRADMTAFFQTPWRDRDLIRFLAAKPHSILHAILDIRGRSRYLLCALQSGWVKSATARKLRRLKIKNFDLPPPRAAAADMELSGVNFRLRKRGWTLPLFSVNGAFFPLRAVAFRPHADGRETVSRHDLGDREAVRELRNMISSPGSTLIVPPDSPFHAELAAAEEDRSSVMRIQTDRKGKRTVDFFPFHGDRRSCILHRDGRYFYYSSRRKPPIELAGEAVSADFTQGSAHAAVLDAESGDLRSSFSFTDRGRVVRILLERPAGQRTLMIVGRGNPLLKNGYPDLISQNVLFAVSPDRIRHAVQYGNRDFRIPRPDDPIDPAWPVSVRRAGDILVVRWGDVSYVLPSDGLLRQLDSGFGCAVKIPVENQIPGAAFISNDPGWDRDITHSQENYYIYIGSDKSKFPALLGQPVLGQYFLAVRRHDGWKFFWNDKLEFSDR